MTRALGIRTVAEGVEISEQAQVLRRAGVDEAQGWRFGRPCTAAVLGASWIQEHDAADRAAAPVPG